MVELLFLSHVGVPCALPSRQVVEADDADETEDWVSFWSVVQPAQNAAAVNAPVDGPEAPGVEKSVKKQEITAERAPRALRIISALGPRWIRASHARLISVPAGQIYEITPLLREALPLPHVVGLAEVQGELVWLVDARRFHPESSV
jgi:hypothetical protein